MWVQLDLNQLRFAKYLTAPEDSVVIGHVKCTILSDPLYHLSYVPIAVEINHGIMKGREGQFPMKKFYDCSVVDEDLRVYPYLLDRCRILRHQNRKLTMTIQ